MEFAPVRVTVEETATGRWELASRAPVRVLAPFVRRILGYIEYDAPEVRREFPSTDIVLIVTLGSPLSISYPRHPGGSLVVKQAFAGGLMDSPIETLTRGLAVGLQVNFTPMGARLFYGLPLHALANRSVELEDVFGAEGRLLVERLNDTPGWDARFATLERAILRRLARAEMTQDGAAWALGRLFATGGRAEIGHLRETLGWSPRQMVDSFRDLAGMPPKTVARLIRFEQAVGRLQDAPGMRLTDLAAECGYFDQAHLNREFRSLAGMSPAALRGELLRSAVPEF